MSGKGTACDRSPLCVAACRSTALRAADVVLLLGARTNWMLHFAAPPRWHPDVRIIQVTHDHPDGVDYYPGDA